MALSRSKVLSLVETQGYIPLFFYQHPEKNKKIAHACFEGGSRVIEFTNRGEGAVQLFAQLVSECRNFSSELAVGAGSVTDPYTAAAFINAGADFIVGPSFCEKTAQLCNSKKIFYIPGCSTLNEILHAEKFGMELIKVFPASCAGGPAFIKAVLGPCPWLRLMPTGGVSTEPSELKQWFDAGAVAVGLGSNIISKLRIEQGDYEGITRSVGDLAHVIESFRQ